MSFMDGDEYLDPEDDFALDYNYVKERYDSSEFEDPLKQSANYYAACIEDPLVQMLLEQGDPIAIKFVNNVNSNLSSTRKRIDWPQLGVLHREIVLRYLINSENLKNIYPVENFSAEEYIIFSKIVDFVEIFEALKSIGCSILQDEHNFKFILVGISGTNPQTIKSSTWLKAVTFIDYSSSDLDTVDNDCDKFQNAKNKFLSQVYPIIEAYALEIFSDIHNREHTFFSTNAYKIVDICMLMLNIYLQDTHATKEMNNSMDVICAKPLNEAIAIFNRTFR